MGSEDANARWKELVSENEGEGTDGEEEEEQRLPRVGEPQSVPLNFSPIVLEKLDKNLFRGPKQFLWRPKGQKGIFGGQVLGQAVSAAVNTVDEGKTLHSMHSYFLRAGKDTSDIIYHVNTLRDGQSFSTRVVSAQQGGKPIFFLMASFQKPNPKAMSWFYPMPIVPSPENVPTEKEYYMALMEDPRCDDLYRKVLKQRALQKAVIDVRRVVTHDYFADKEMPPDYEPPIFVEYTTERKQIMWIRSFQRLDDDPNTHRAVLAYASDIGMLATAKGTVPLHLLSQVASLDHSLWYYADFRADEWLLFVVTSPRGASDRGLTYGRIYRQDGVLAVGVSQEGMLRVRENANL